MAKDTKVQELIINELTKSRYEQMKDSGTLNENELYMVTDEEYVSPEDLATVATTGDYNDLSNTPDLANVATTGDYNDLINTPDLATVATTGDYNDLTHTPTIPVVDQTYDSTSTNAQSGVAVAEALETVTIDIDNDTITRNNNEELQSVGIINPRTNTSLKIWEGTEEQWINGEPTPWYYWQTSEVALWTASTMPSSTDWQSVTYGDGKFVAIVQNTDKSAYSTDGVNWIISALPSLIGGHGQSVTYGDGKFVVVANSSDKSAYSTDGINWTASTLPTSTYWESVTYGNGKFVAVATSSDKAAYSTDGINWTISALPSSAGWISVTYGNGKFVAVAFNSDKSAYSIDGVNWTETTMPSSTYWQSIAYGNGKFVAVTRSSNKSAYSTDGINWTASTLPSRANWYSVTYGDGKFVVVAFDSNKAAYSTDGINWNESTLPSSVNWRSVTYGDGKFVAVARNSDASAIFTMSYDKCYTLDQIPTTSTQVYSALETPSTKTITSTDDGTITLSDNLIYNYTPGGNQNTYRTIGDAHPDWLCNIKGVAVKIGNTIIANNTTSAEWGNITGDLDDQLDLKNALDAKKVSMVNWETSTTTNLDNLIINKLTKQQYDSILEKDENQLYMITSTEDDRIIVDDELDSTSENPVQNKVIVEALSEKIDSSDLATVATTGDYTDLSNTPTIPVVDQTYDSTSTNAQSGVAVAEALATVNSAEWGNITGDLDDQLDLKNALGEKVDSSSLATVATTGDYNDLTNTPNLATVATSGDYNDLTHTLTAGTLINIDSNNEISTSASKVSYKDWDGSSSTTTDISNLVINNLTQEEYDDLVENDQINDNELYMILNSNYVTQSELEEVLSGKQDTLTAGAGISINNNVISTNGNVIKIVDDTPLIPEDGVVYFIKESE